jgi:hypothetical protein
VSASGWVILSATGEIKVSVDISLPRYERDMLLWQNSLVFEWSGWKPLPSQIFSTPTRAEASPELRTPAHLGKCIGAGGE